MPEGDTIAWHASRIRPVLEGHVPDEIATPHPRHQFDRWPDRLSGRAVRRVDTHGKHLLLRFEGDLVLHSHLAMTGTWGVYRDGRRWARAPGRAWLVVRRAGHTVVQFDGPLLELITEGRSRFDQRLAALGPDVLAPEFRRRRLPAAPARRRPDPDDRRRPPRPAHCRRHREPLEVGGLLGGGGRSVAPLARRVRRRGADRRRGDEAPHAALGSRGTARHRAPRLSPLRPSLPALRRPNNRPWTGRRQSHDILV